MQLVEKHITERSDPRYNAIDEAAAPMIEYSGETYLTVTEVARRFHISRTTCQNNILKYVQACYLPGRKNALYRQSEVEQFSEIRVVCQQDVSIAAKQSAHVLPSS